MAQRIESLNIDLTRGSLNHTIETVGEEIVKLRPNKTGREWRYRDASRAGKTSGLTMRQYVERVLIRNELLACTGNPLTNHQIEHSIYQEFPSQKLNYIRDKRISIGQFRNRYMGRKLYASQPIPVLIALRYDEGGYPVQSSSASKFMTYLDCIALCEKYKIADPRFYSKDQILAIARRQNDNDNTEEWYYPTLDEIEAIQSKVDRPLLDSIRFPEGLGRPNVPH